MNQEESEGEEGDSIEEQIEDNLKQKASSSEVKRSQEIVKMEKEEEEEEEVSIVSEGESVEDEKFLMESEERVDRVKIDTIEESLLRVIEQIKQGARYCLDPFRELISQTLSGEELLQSKITNMLSYIIHSRKEYSSPHAASPSRKRRKTTRRTSSTASGRRRGRRRGRS
jgi:hypothetical protein